MTDGEVRALDGRTKKMFYIIKRPTMLANPILMTHPYKTTALDRKRKHIPILPDDVFGLILEHRSELMRPFKIMDRMKKKIEMLDKYEFSLEVYEDDMRNRCEEGMDPADLYDIYAINNEHWLVRNMKEDWEHYLEMYKTLYAHLQDAILLCTDDEYCPYMVPDITECINDVEDYDVNTGENVEVTIGRGNYSTPITIEIISKDVGYRRTWYFGNIIRSEVNPEESPWADPKCWNLNLGAIRFEKPNDYDYDEFE